MRMWTTVLVENGNKVGYRAIPDGLINTGQFFDAFCFVGPRDVQSFFLAEGADDLDLFSGLSLVVEPRSVQVGSSPRNYLYRSGHPLIEVGPSSWEPDQH
jgi:hypothetical protein